MRNQTIMATAGLAAAILIAAGPAVAAGDAERGKSAFRQCAACHSVDKDAHRTGPSLAGIWGRKAGTIDGFRRYSKAMKDADMIWDEKTLDRWMADPKAVIPGNRMVFRGVVNAGDRRDLIAFLKSVAGDGGSHATGVMPGGMMGQGPMNLKGLGPDNQVARVTKCGDTFDVTTHNGKTHQFWETNLRLKIDTSESGPAKGTPVLIPGGMRGDRANLVFTSPEEIGAIIQPKC